MNREMFKVYKKDVVVKINGEEQSYSLLPLSGRFLPKLMGLAGSKQADSEGNVSFEEKDFSTFHELTMETLKFSYKIDDSKELEELDLFVSQNLMVFVPVLFAVNGLNTEE